MKPVESEEEGEKIKITRALRRVWIYITVEITFTMVWIFASTLSLVYYIMEVYRGNLLRIGLVEASISLATIAGTYITDRISVSKSFRAFKIGTIITILWLLIVMLSPPFIFILLAFYIGRLGDTITFIFKRNWYYEIVSDEEIALIEGSIESVRKALYIASPLLCGIVANIDPKLPYMFGLVFMIILLILYEVARKLSIKSS